MPKSTKTNSDILGINWQSAKPYAFCGGLKWEINPIAHTKRIVDVIMKAVKEYDAEIIKIQQGKSNEFSRSMVYENATRTILENGLLKFSYVKAANDPQAGPALLGMLAGELKDFFLSGGVAGMQHVQTIVNSTNVS